MAYTDDNIHLYLYSSNEPFKITDPEEGLNANMNIIANHLNGIKEDISKLQDQTQGVKTVMAAPGLTDGDEYVCTITYSDNSTTEFKLRNSFLDDKTARDRLIDCLEDIINPDLPIANKQISINQLAIALGV